MNTPTQPLPASPRRNPFPGPSSPRHNRPSIASRLPSISASQPLDFDELRQIQYAQQQQQQTSNPSTIIHGFSPPPLASPLPAYGSPRAPHLGLNTTNHALLRLSPQLTTPIEQTFQFDTRQNASQFSSSPRGLPDLPPRSRRNSAAIVSISLSSRSRSRTPRGGASVLPGGSGQGTPSKGSSSVTPRGEDLLSGSGSGSGVGSGSWARGMDDFEDDWLPAGGMLLGTEEEVIEDEEDADEGRDDADGDYEGRTWTGLSEASRVVEHVLKPGMLFGEGLEFQGEVIVPAVGRVGDGELGVLPLRRGGSEAGRSIRTPGTGNGVHGLGGGEGTKRVYEVVRQLGSGSYAVVYLVREKGGRKREFALKCLSKQDLEEEQLETQLFEATIHLSLPIHTNIVTLHQTLQTNKWLFLMLELCPGEDLFFWLEKSRDASPPPVNAALHDERTTPMSSSKFSSSSIPFSSSQLFSGLHNPLSSSFNSSTFSPNHSASPASLLFAHNNGQTPTHHFLPSQTPPTPSLLSAFSANTLLSSRRLRLIASMFSQMCEAVAVCHDAGVSHRDIKPENFICCDSVELESGEGELDFGPQAKRKVVVKLTDFGLATTEEESGDVECGSKPYMSYECRNNLGPAYAPAPADVWSLGIVLINMLFHRNPWKDPAPGDTNFDNFLRDPTGFLLTKFTGIGREVATYLAEQVLCTDVEDRVGARELGKWVKGLPEMIAGRRAIHQLKMARLEMRSGSSGLSGDKGLFVKSPIEVKTDLKVVGGLTSALTSSAPNTAASLGFVPGLSALPHHSQLAAPPSPEDTKSTTTPTPDLDIELNSATTVDEQPTPADTDDYPSPETPDIDGDPLDDSRSLSTHKRRKRGVRKGKAAQALLAAASSDGPSQEERDALLAELAAASQHLARDLSKLSHNDLDKELDFPPLGTTPSQAAAAKKSKWKDLMKMGGSSGNPELAALARRVAERDASTGGNWSAPAQLQHTSNRDKGRGGDGFKQTATMSSGVSSALSSFGPVSSATSSSGGVEDDDWRKRPDDVNVNGNVLRGRDVRRGRKGGNNGEDTSRARQAALAAAAITGNMEPMGSFGVRPSGVGGLGGKRGVTAPLLSTTHSASSGYTVRASVPVESKTPRAAGGLQPILDEEVRVSSKVVQIQPPLPIPVMQTQPQAIQSPLTASSVAKTIPKSTIESSSFTTRPTMSSVESTSTIMELQGTSVGAGGGGAGVGQGVSPNKPKLKGQIQSLAKMLSGLKTKGKD